MDLLWRLVRWSPCRSYEVVKYYKGDSFCLTGRNRILYPDLVFGAIASSGVTHAALENWEYFEIIRQAAEPECSSSLQNAIETIDTLLNIPFLRRFLKGLFGLADLEHDDDFVSLLTVS